MAAKMHEFAKHRDPVAPSSMRSERTLNTPRKTRVYRGSWIVTLPMAGVAAAYVMLVFLPGRRAIGEARDKIEQSQKHITQATAMAAALPVLEEELRTTQAYNTAWEENSPGQGGLSALYGKINALAKAVGTTTTRFDPEPVVPRDTIREIPIAMACTGSFAQLFNFIQSLEGLPEEIWVNSYKLENIAGKEGSVTCELTLVVFASNSKNSDYVENSE